ncbi:hypothetical protein EYC98_19960 [Halieaceae bacterium IMCC14734]|uniref:Uncharacterized protein n=1 Tax=Candidatus Litorirhabdus singularis TaxID=2518993 RepID=A0ABT3TLE1_9GAMM|nr:hypothetical protein [Candidatus Litorirhabdus singularis]MCX2983143.1 hypothetical protein [Candidatus Litorirhabdus singularis]
MLPINKIFGLTLALIACYACYQTLSQTGMIYQNFTAFFESSVAMAILATAAVLLVPVSVLALAYLVNLNQRKYLILLPLSHAAILLPGFLSIVVVAIVLVWWFSKYGSTAG